jgi:F-type H+-transporting ATPase subunit b
MIGQLIVIQLVTFIALIVVMRALFYRHLNSALRRLHELQEEGMIKEAQLREELDRAKEQRLSEVEKGKEEAQGIVEATRRDCELLHTKAEEQAKQDAERIVHKAEQELEKLKMKLVSDIEEETLQLSLQIIRRTFTERDRELLQGHLIEDLLPEIERLEKEQMQIAGAKIRVTAAFPLTENQRMLLRTAFARKSGAEVELEEHLSAELITGLMIEIGAMVIDGSLKNRLKKVALCLKADTRT